MRTTLLLASALALVGFVVFPTAPPRLSGVGIVDTVSGRQVDLNKGLVSSLYNPFAAVPSMHVGYALIVGGSLARYARHLITRIAGVAYPALVVLVTVATGNHFLIDAAAGAAAAGVALVVAAAARDEAIHAPAASAAGPPLVGDRDARGRRARGRAEGCITMSVTNREAMIRRAPMTEEARWVLALTGPFVGTVTCFTAAIATGITWLIAPAIVAGPGAGVIVLVLLALSSDTNGPAAQSAFDPASSADISAAVAEAA